MSAPVPETVPETALEAMRAAEAGESRHRYPARAVLLDYFYAGLGLLFTLGPLAGTAPTGPAAWVLGRARRAIRRLRRPHRAPASDVPEGE